MASDETTLPSDIFLDMDRSSPVPLYYQISTRLEKAIREGIIPAGARLETELSIGARLGLSRPTVRRALQELVDKGLLVRRRGIGTQVVNGKVTRNVELTSLYDDLGTAGQHPETTVLSSGIRPADGRIAEALGVPLSSDTLHLSRLRKADGVALAILDNILPGDFADLMVDDLSERGLYQLLRARGVTMRVAKQQIGARAATTAEAQLLGINRGGPLLTMTRTAFDNNGRAIEFGQHVYRPDLYSFEMTLVDR